MTLIVQSVPLATLPQQVLQIAGFKQALHATASPIPQLYVLVDPFIDTIVDVTLTIVPVDEQFQVPGSSSRVEFVNCEELIPGTKHFAIVAYNP